MDEIELKNVKRHIEARVNEFEHILNDECIAGSKAWFAFNKGFDETTKSAEATFESGFGDSIVINLVDIEYNDGRTYFKFVIDTIVVDNAKINITNMRRHGFVDYRQGVIDKGITDPYQIYQNSRFHCKMYDSLTFKCTNLADHKKDIVNALKSVIRIGKRNQLKNGVSDMVIVARNARKTSISECATAIHLVDSGMQYINAIINANADWFANIETKYQDIYAKLYHDPYNKTSKVYLPVECTIYSNKDKFTTRIDPLKVATTEAHDKYFLFKFTYFATFDIDTDEYGVDEERWTYNKPYYFSDPKMKFPDDMKTDGFTLTASLTDGVFSLTSSNPYTTRTDALDSFKKVISNMQMAQQVRDNMLATLQPKG